VKVTPRKLIFRIAIVLALAALAALAVVRALRPVRVAAVVVATGEIQGKVHGPGTVQAKVPVTVSVKITGILTKLYADQGDRVKRGQLLAELDSTELKSRAAAARSAEGRSARDLTRARADLLKAEANLALARSNFERDRAVFQPGYITAAAFDASKSALRVAESEVAASKAAVAAIEAARAQTAHDAAAARDVFDYTRIVAPMDGLITVRKAEIGDTIAPAAPVFQMVDYRIWAASWIDERAIADLREGQKATISLRSGRVFEGRVARLASAADTVTRELEVDVQFATLPSPLVIGEETEVTIETARRTAPTVPLAALLTRNGVQGVMVIAAGRARFRPVVTGVRDDDRAAVVKGLQAGDVVIVTPGGVTPGTRVTPQLGAAAARQGG
jgi:RND family efflux transporter MFP subunit